ncbi:hypothetical protein CAPTEDRAFT_220885 [Capitella teleta]|uniref:Uncharacterized protein n=1 Tax=Capitella teleta TaxID=283909 RepID=R7VD64_CAPTE|nr:hypothetical protein CAPTEDRAFT_220885 [Capitella teleta]|eukprot:ELU14226.1 hypothetical protein CAPTEDRAFT_220885 [Capitella teleta]
MCEAKSGFCLGMSFVTLGGILLCILCAEKIPSYMHTKDFKKSTCLIQQTAFVGNVCCDISQPSNFDNCNTVYPCFSTQVNFDDGDGTQQSGVLFDKYRTYAYQSNGLCSYYVCGYRPYADFLKDAQKYADGDGAAGLEVDCAYDPDYPNVVMRQVTRVDYIVHSVLWPTIILIIGSVITLVSCMADAETNFGNECYRRCGGKHAFSKDDVEDLTSPETAVVELSDSTDDVKYSYENESFENESCPPQDSAGTKRKSLAPEAEEAIE